MSTKQAIAPKYLTVLQATQFANLSKETIYKLVYDGKIQARRVGRRVLINIDELERFIESCK